MGESDGGTHGLSTGSIRVLLVDDESDVAAVTAEFLERSNETIDVVVEYSGQSGLDRLSEQPIDCVVSDYQMPGMNGVEFLRRVRESHTGLPFILYTGQGSEDLASEAISAGVTDYLQKGSGTEQYEMLSRQVENAVAKRRAELRVHEYLEASPDGIVIVGADGTIRRVNEQTEVLFGYDRGDLHGEPVEVLLPERFRESHVEYRDEYVASPERRPMGTGLELFGRRADGSEFPVDVSLSPLVYDGHHEVIASVRDATERKRRAETLSELDRVNRTLRETLQAALHHDDRKSIQRAVCELLADSDPYVFAWIGTETEDGEIVPEASAGIDDGYLDAITITVDEEPAGRGPTGRAARSGEPQTTQSVEDDPRFEPWREQARKRGYESSAAIPLRYDGTRYGLLNLYADRPNAFDDRELDVLTEVGTAIAHAIHRVELTARLEE